MNFITIIYMASFLFLCIFIVILLIFFYKVTNRIAKVLKKSPSKAKRDIKFIQICGIFILIATIYVVFDVVFKQNNSEKIEASDILFILGLFSVSILLLVFSTVLKRGVDLIEERNEK